jgi:hypothetical protein
LFLAGRCRCGFKTFAGHPLRLLEIPGNDVLDTILHDHSPLNKRRPATAIASTAARFGAVPSSIEGRNDLAIDTPLLADARAYRQKAENRQVALSGNTWQHRLSRSAPRIADSKTGRRDGPLEI